MAQFTDEYKNHLKEKFGSATVPALQVRAPDTKIKKVAKDVGKRTFGGALKILDIVERPYYGLMNIGKDLYGGEEGFNPFRAFYRGFTGQEKTTFGDVTTEAGWTPQTVAGKITKGAVDFAGGVFLDPMTYFHPFGKAAKGAVKVGGTALSKQGSRTYFKAISKATGKKVRTLKEMDKLYGVVDNMDDIAARIGKEIFIKGQLAPEVFFAKNTMVFAGKEFGGNLLEGMSKKMSKTTELLGSVKIGKKTLASGKKIDRTLGQLFNSTYDIRHANYLSPEELARLSPTRARNLQNMRVAQAVSIVQDRRNAEAWMQYKAIEESQNVFKGMNKQKREETVSWVEKFLKGGNAFQTRYGEVEKKALTLSKRYGFLDNLMDEKKIILSGKTKSEYFRGTIDDFISKGKNSEALALAIRAEKESRGKTLKNYAQFKIRESIGKELGIGPKGVAKLSDIKDEQVRKVVASYRDRMKLNADELIKAGTVDDELKFIKDGYVKRILEKGDRMDENVLRAIGRTEGSLPISEVAKKYEAGELPYKFIMDAAQTFTETNLMTGSVLIKKQMVDNLVSQNFLRLAKKGEKKAGSLIDFSFGGKRYMGHASLVREVASTERLLQDPGITTFWSFYDKVNNFFKYSVTTPFPSFHTRNAYGNIFLNYLGGNTSLKNYKAAFDLQRYARQVRLGKEAKDKIVQLGNRKFKLSELYRKAGENSVLGSNWYSREFYQKLHIKTGELKNTPSWVFNKTRRVGTYVEDNGRVALFFDQLGKGVDSKSASLHMKKFMFDYGDLSEFERTTLKRVIPFYTWMRKNVPLQLEQIVKNPGKYTPFVHAQQAVEGMSSADEDMYLPDWMRQEEMFVRLPDKSLFNPDLPFQDLANIFDLKQWVSSTSPLIKGVFELTANKNFFTGKPLADERLPSSKYKRELWKTWLLDQMRATTFWRKAKAEDRDSFQFWLDYVFGLRTYPFDSARARQGYYSRQAGEISAEVRFDRKKAEEKEKVTKGIKTILPFLK